MEKGRTLWEIITGRNKQKETPVELQYRNPLGIKLGQFIQFDQEPNLTGIDFTVEHICACETRIGTNKFYHTDYSLRGITIDSPKPIHLQLRLVEDEDETNELGCKLMLLHAFHEQEYDSDFYELCMANGDHDDQCDEPGENTFKVNYDEDGHELDTPQRYWRCEDVPSPYHARTTWLTKNGDKVESENGNITYWDFSRITEDEGDQELVEYLYVEMDMTPDAENRTSQFMTILRGPEIKAFQVRVT